MTDLNKIKEIVDHVHDTQNISKEELEVLLNLSNEEAEYLNEKAREVRESIYGKDVYIRGLIEVTNYCKNDCYYCGIRRSNKNADRYRLSKEQILECCATGYDLGFRTFVLQGGEDAFFNEEYVCDIVRTIKEKYSDCAVTLSLGEWPRSSFEKFYEAGADRYLLRHETADSEHYGKLHPEEMSFKHRMQCLRDLKDIGFQVGCGFMVGSPYQTVDTLYKDLMFILDLKPHMVGIGPFISQKDTPFADKESGTLTQTLRLLSIIRLIHPGVLLPSTTALGTIHPLGREMGIQAGGNVVMPNLSPVSVREKYALYDNKICTGDEAAECRFCMQRRMESIGYSVVTARGDSKIE